MTYWIGTEAAITAANEMAFAAYIAANPTAEQGGVTVPNLTTRWAEPAQTADGQWAIPACPNLDPPDGCTPLEVVDWPAPEPVSGPS